jgi:hypothetical protein
LQTRLSGKIEFFECLDGLSSRPNGGTFDHHFTYRITPTRTYKNNKDKKGGGGGRERRKKKKKKRELDPLLMKFTSISYHVQMIARNDYGSFRN